MFKITQDQIDALARASVRKLADRMVRRVAKRIKVDPDLLSKMVELGIERAGRQGITVEKEVSRFVGLVLTVDDHLDEEASKALTQPDGSGDEFSDKGQVGAVSPCPKKRKLRFSA